MKYLLAGRQNQNHTDDFRESRNIYIRRLSQSTLYNIPVQSDYTERISFCTRSEFLLHSLWLTSITQLCRDSFIVSDYHTFFILRSRFLIMIHTIQNSSSCLLHDNYLFESSLYHDLSVYYNQDSRVYKEYYRPNLNRTDHHLLSEYLYNQTDGWSSWHCSIS